MNKEDAATQNDYIITTVEADCFFTHIADRNSTFTSFSISLSFSTILDEQVSLQALFIIKKQVKKTLTMNLCEPLSIMTQRGLL